MVDRIIEITDKRMEFGLLEDGFLYYCPCGGGAIGAHDLRKIADELDRRNEPWEKQIERDLKQSTPDSEPYF